MTYLKLYIEESELKDKAKPSNTNIKKTNIFKFEQVVFCYNFFNVLLL